MIRNYGDHAANERTLLAWIRTALAVAGFGFVIERFDLLTNASLPFSRREHYALIAEIIGTFSISLGVFMVVFSVYRFSATSKLLDSNDNTAGYNLRIGELLVGLVTVIALSSLIYLSGTLYGPR
jgi:putative membrane protein